MKYADLLQFEPVESVIQLRGADASEGARRLVETFVISDGMATNLAKIVFPQLGYDVPSDNKALLIVGNYGTGKSHLMAVISAIAEFPELAAKVTHQAVASAAASVAGRFKVVRMETTSTKMGLRDLLCRTLTSRLGELGVNHTFPEAREVVSNKDDFVSMMAAFHEVYPNQGLLLVLDELLDYLRTRDQQEIILDLNFLRELGEVCKSTRFRFMSGVQESLFDTPRFQFLADTLIRVKARFEQVHIAREDVSFVVSQRILKKSAEQKGRIREHLSHFSKLYGDMNERMDRYVELFPVHPAYLETFEKVHVAEKREVLKTLSVAIKARINSEVPKDEPGLLAYDGYWAQLAGDAVFRAVPDIREVVEKSDVLADRVQNGLSRPQYRGVAMRIVHALSVHRLTTGDIYAPIGATAEELRDNLCLMVPGLPEHDADFLRTLVERVLADISKTMSGQYLSHNPENGQWYLDLKKVVAFDSLIEKRAEALSPDELNRYYFDILALVLEVQETTYRSGYKIWEYAVEWRERRAERRGYLFFGNPDERSTTQPSREFYLYFLQPWAARSPKGEGLADEVFFRLKHPDAEFEKALRLYSGAKEQAATSSGSNKATYEDKARGYQATLTKWLRERMSNAFEVTWQGKPRLLAEVVQGKLAGGAARAGGKELITAAAGVCLASTFADKAPEYPIFSTLITVGKDGNLEQAAQDALRFIGGGVKSKNGVAVLDALELLDGDALRARNSRYAKTILDRLAEKKANQVLTRGELIEDDGGVEYWLPTRFRLEPEFLVVVLAALVHAGGIELSLPGAKIDAANLDQLVRMQLRDVVQFKHIGQPRELPLEALKELFELLGGLNQGQLVHPNTRETAVAELQKRVAVLLEHVVTSKRTLQGGFPLWGHPILSEAELDEWSRRLTAAKTFLESIQPFNTVGKLKNFPHDVVAIHAQRPNLTTRKDVEDLERLVREYGPLTAWLSTAEAVLPDKHPWRAEVSAARLEARTRLSSPAHRQDPGFRGWLGQEVSRLRAGFQAAYRELHTRQRLSAAEDDKKGKLTRDARLGTVRALGGVHMMPVQKLTKFQNDLHGVLTCFSLQPTDLEASPICPHCQFRPVEEPTEQPAAARLAALDDQLDTMLDEWTATLLANLGDPTVAANIELLTDAEGKAALVAFLAARTLPEPVSPAFVKAANEVLGGLERVSVTATELAAKLGGGGAPCSVADLEGRFAKFVAELKKGRDPAKMRVVIEQE